MKLSAPLHLLKSHAKIIKKNNDISITEALNHVAQSEGYLSWSLLQAQQKLVYPNTKREVLEYLNPGDLMLIGARPGLGKTQFALDILFQALDEGRHCYFFSLEYTSTNISTHFNKLLDDNVNTRYLSVDLSDDISASYIVEKTRNTISTAGIILIDYLQLLDQKRSNPEIQEQIEILKSYAKEMKCIIIFISQLDRSFDENKKSLPKTNDIRMPNEFDLTLFNKLMLIHEDRKLFLKPAQFELN